MNRPSGWNIGAQPFHDQLTPLYSFNFYHMRDTGPVMSEAYTRSA